MAIAPDCWAALPSGGPTSNVGGRRGGGLERGRVGKCRGDSMIRALLYGLTLLQIAITVGTLPAYSQSIRQAPQSSAPINRERLPAPIAKILDFCIDQPGGRSCAFSFAVFFMVVVASWR
jgi:hypothetical protein